VGGPSFENQNERLMLMVGYCRVFSAGHHTRGKRCQRGQGQETQKKKLVFETGVSV